LTAESDSGRREQAPPERTGAKRFGLRRRAAAFPHRRHGYGEWNDSMRLNQLKAAAKKAN
jgi:hypothetical protein